MKPSGSASYDAARVAAAAALEAAHIDTVTRAEIRALTLDMTDRFTTAATDPASRIDDHTRQALRNVSDAGLRRLRDLP